MSTRVLKFLLKAPEAMISSSFLPFTISPVVSASTPQLVSASVIVWAFFWLPILFLLIDWIG